MSATATFVHLRVHTAYSLSEGAIRVKALPKLCRAEAMPAVAITDTNNLFGALEFAATLGGEGIQPIIGCQLSLRRGELPSQPGSPPQRSSDASTSAVVLLVQTGEGYANLLHLLHIAYTEPESSEGPQVTLDALIQHADGLILLTGGPGGPVGRLLLENKRDEATALLARLAAAFPDRLYVEIMRHGLADEDVTENAFLDLAHRQSLPIVATNDVHFATPDLYEAHDALLCIAQGTVLTNPERRRLSPEHYLKSPAAMAALFADLPDAVGNTVRIARRCSFFLGQVKPMLPHFDCGPGRDEEAVLRAQAAAGLDARLTRHIWRDEMDEAPRNEAAQPYRERLEFELDVICKMGFPGYFLVVAEFIQWAKQHGIPVGPGRGSGAGSVVAWALTITDLDPIRFGLLFERFLNPERVSMPDFDIDFCQDRRDEVIAHVQGKYGIDRVAQIITFGKLQARAVLRDVGRVLGMPYGQVDRICKLVPNNPAHPVTLDEAIKGEPQLQAMIADDETVARLVGIARPLEGLYRHASTHAAGVVIADRPLEELVPLYRDPRSPMLVTGFNMKWVEAAGLVKFDFLGLKTLTVLAKAVELLERRQGIAFDLSHLPLDDAKSYDLLGRGDTVGVFQLESAGMRDVLRKLKPDKLEDIIAVVALYRPGPMDNIPSYIRRKHGQEEPDYLHPALEGILRETYGIMIYQEQVMQIAQVLSGYTLGGADLLRRAMGKKIKEEMDKQRQSFVDGATARKVAAQKASQIFDQVAKFAGYGFNKSHAAAYALVAYQTAYMKANHPYEFFAASMTLDLGNSDKLNGYRQELDRLGILLLPPDINASEETFSVEYGADGAAATGVRYGLAAVKTVGMGAVASLVAERRRGGAFRSLDDFASRLDAKQVNKRQLENLARAGAFDSLNRNRKQVVESIEMILRRAGARVAERDSGQIGLFGGVSQAAELPALHLAETEDWSSMERLKEELDAIGFYLSAHPLDAYAGKLKKLGVTGCGVLMRRPQSGAYTLAGTVLAKRERSSAKGNRYAFVQLSDPTGLFEITVFSELLATKRELIEPGQAVLVRAQVQAEGEALRITAQELDQVERAVAQLGSEINIHVDRSDAITRLRDILTSQPAGRDTVKLTAQLEDGVEVVLQLPLRIALRPDDLGRLANIAGVQTVSGG